MSEASVLDVAQEFEPFVESDAADNPAQLRATMERQGYLFFRSLVPPEDVLGVRRAVLELCAEAGWLDRDRATIDGVVAPGLQPTSEGQPPYMAVYRKVLRLRSFHGFPEHPALLAVARVLLGEQVLVHPRRIGRITFPNYTVATTPPHQDHFYIRGSVDTYSCWTPLGDCPTTLGGLAVWPGSHRHGFIEHTVHHAGAVGGRGVPVDTPEAVWHTGDFHAGDALFFHAFSIHTALPNLSADRLRISTDNRYQRPDDEIDPGALRPHFDLG
ncbi:MAG: phytanoyl-CoA dioxygenase family protein [Chloroflexales bacterium]|nr:phytanoyl-CoA dioxygenase family protein [Chloroflexales bacterium]